MPVTFSTPHILMSFHGALPGGENWSCGIRTQAATIDPAAMQPYADYAAQCFQFAYHGETATDSWASMWSGATTFEGVTVRALDVNGVTQSQAEGKPTVPISGSGGTTLPDTTAVCITLTSALAGRSGKGRFFLPMTSGGSTIIGADGRIPGPWVLKLVDRIALFLNALNGNKDVLGTQIKVPVPAAVFRIAVQSTKPGKGPSAISGFEIGDVPDNISGRKSKLREVYAVGPVVTPLIPTG